MFDFVQKLRDRGQQKVQQVQTDRQRYVALVRKGGTGGTLTAAESDDLATLAESLSIPAERVEADAAAFAENVKYDAGLALLKQAEADKAKAEAAVKAERDRFAPIEQQHRDTLAKLNAASEAFDSTIRAGRKLAIQADQHRKTHWSLFGGQSPAEQQAAADKAGRVRYVLYRTPDATERHGRGDNVFWIESVMIRLNDPQLWNGFESFDFRRATGQSAEEFDYLLAMLKKARTVGDRMYFVRSGLRNDLNGSPPPYMDLRARTIRVEEYVSEKSPDIFTFIRSAGQSESDLAALVQMLHDRHRAYQNRLPIPHNIEPIVVDGNAR